MLDDPMAAEALLSKAHLLHERGQVAPAFELYKQILTLAPAQQDALIGMGRALVQVGQPDDARVVLDKAVLVAPDRGEAHGLLGICLLVLGLWSDAEQSFERALALDPQSPETWCNLGLARLELEAWPAAADAFRRAIDLRPDYAEAQNGLGEALISADDHEGAREALRGALAANPELVEAHNNFGRLEMQLEHFTDALEHFNRALALRPADPGIVANQAGATFHLERSEEAAALCLEGLKQAPDDLQLLRQLSLIYWDMEDWENAKEYAERVVAVNPDGVDDLLALGRCLIKVHKPADAIEPLRRVYEADPESATAAGWLAQAYHLTFQFEEADWLYREAVRLIPESARSYAGLAQLLRDQGRLEEAADMGLQGIAHEPDGTLIRCQHALTLLTMGRLGEGWDMYEARFNKESGLKHGYERGVVWDRTDKGGAPMWQGEPLEGKRIAVYTEQGPGDMIMYLNCLPDMIEQAAEVQLIAQTRMVDLLQRSFPTVKVEGYRKLQRGLDAPREVDFNIPLGSALRYLRRCEADFPSRGRYLKTDPDKVAFWRERFRALLPGGEGLAIGISWRGGVGPYFGTIREMDLSDWLPLFKCPNTAFVSLQYGTLEDRKGWLDEFEQSSGIRIADWDDSDPKDDLDGLAAQVEALDLVISIANTTVHFAGATGQPCWTIVPKMPSWRWLRGRTDNVWYPTMRLFWQQDDEDNFAPVMERVAAQYLQNAPARRFYPDSWRGEPGNEEGV